MQLGVFMMPSHPPERDFYAGHAWDLDHLELIDKLGFDEAWIGEHEPALSHMVQKRHAVCQLDGVMVGSSGLPSDWKLFNIDGYSGVTSASGMSGSCLRASTGA